MLTSSTSQLAPLRARSEITARAATVGTPVERPSPDARSAAAGPWCGGTGAFEFTARGAGDRVGVFRVRGDGRHDVAFAAFELFGGAEVGVVVAFHRL